MNEKLIFTIRSLAILRWFNRFYIFDSFEINDVIVYFSSTVELALTANCPQKLLHLVPAGSPYIESFLTSSQRPHLYNGNGHYSASTATNSTAATFFQPLTKKSEIVAKFDSYGALMINRGNLISIVFHLFC